MRSYVPTTDAGGGDASCIRVFDLATPQIPRVYVAQNDVIRDVAFTDRSMLAMMSSGAILTQLLSSETGRLPESSGYGGDLTQAQIVFEIDLM